MVTPHESVLGIARESRDWFDEPAHQVYGAEILEQVHTLHGLEDDRRWAGRARRVQVITKRTCDVLFAMVLLLILLPLLAVIAVAVKCSSSGPILFRQQRVGKHGCPFQFYKFRTMYHGSDERIHKQHYVALVNGQAKRANGTFKLAHDPRITPVGRFLRRASLDELPQLFNVLKGEMSLVGPRPAIPYEVELYGPRERMRLWVPPGLTGLWQVSGRCELSFDEMIDLDLAYIQRWSLWLDLMIVLRTPLVVLSGRGAG